jgi:hypothetical protein
MKHEDNICKPHALMGALELAGHLDHRPAKAQPLE